MAFGNNMLPIPSNSNFPCLVIRYETMCILVSTITLLRDRTLNMGNPFGKRLLG